MLLEGSIDLVRHVGRDETRLGAMDVPGRWAGGFRAWDEHGAYLATGRAATAGRHPPGARRGAAQAVDRAVPARPATSSRACPGPPATTRRWPGSGRPSPPSAPWPPGSRTSSTTPPPQPRGRSTPSARRTRECCPPSDGSPRLRSPPISSPGSTPCVRSSDARPPGDPMALADREDALSDWLSEHDVTRDWVLAPVARRCGCRRRLVRAGRRGARRGPAGAGARVGGEHPVLDRTAGGGQGVHPAHLRPRRGGQVLRPARSGRPCSRPTSPRGSRARW